MNWYYVDAGQQAGPVDDAGFETLVCSGKVQPETLVWREGLANWQPYRELNPAAAAVPVGAATVPTGLMLEPSATQAVCAECGGLFNVEEMVPYGSIRVCAHCKPILMQKLAEGAQLKTGELNYAGFWTRFAAVFLDGILLGGFNMLLSYAFLGVSGAFGPQMSGRGPAGPPVAFFLVFFLEMAVALSYETVLIGRYGATLGKMACRIKVVTADGGRVSYPRSLGRYFAKIISGMICLIGYIMAGFDDQKRALHDRLCNTRVVLR